jgi:hypothetical protein
LQVEIRLLAGEKRIRQTVRRSTVGRKASSHEAGCDIKPETGHLPLLYPRSIKGERFSLIDAGAQDKAARSAEPKRSGIVIGPAEIRNAPDHGAAEEGRSSAILNVPVLRILALGGLQTEKKGKGGCSDKPKNVKWRT